MLADTAVKPGTKIRFLKRIEEGPDDYAPGCLFCDKDEIGEIVGKSLHFDYVVKSNDYPYEFSVMREEFEVI